MLYKILDNRLLEDTFISGFWFNTDANKVLPDLGKPAKK